MLYKKAVSALIILSFLCQFYVACTPANGLQIIEHSIVVNEFTADRSQSTATVSGKAQNSADRPSENCVIMVTFYDNKGSIVSTKNSMKDRLSPGELWNFKIELKGPEAWNVARYGITTTSK